MWRPTSIEQLEQAVRDGVLDERPDFDAKRELPASGSASGSRHRSIGQPPAPRGHAERETNDSVWTLAASFSMTCFAALSCLLPVGGGLNRMTPRRHAIPEAD